MYKILKNVKDEQISEGSFFQNYLNNSLTLELIRNGTETRVCADLKNLELDTLSSLADCLNDFPEVQLGYSKANGYFLETSFEGRFRDTKREAIKAFKEVGKKMNVNFSPMLSYLRDLNLRDVKEHDGNILYNENDFFKVSLDDDLFVELGIDSILEPDLKEDHILVYKKGTFDGAMSTYCSLMSKEMSNPVNRIGLVISNLYPGFAPGEDVIKPLLRESVGYYLRSKVFQRSEDLYSLVEGYKDLERAFRVSKYAFDNYKDCDFPFPDLINNLANHYSRVITERAKSAFDLFSKTQLYSNAARTLIREISSLEKLETEFVESTGRILPDSVSDMDTLLTESQEYLISVFGETSDKIRDRINFLKSHRQDAKSKILFHLASNERALVKRILDNEGSERLEGTYLEKEYKEDGILALMNYISEFPPFIKMISPEELPMFDRLNFCLDPAIEDYEGARNYSELYNKIVKTRDFLGFKDESNFLFNFVEQEEE